MRTDVSKRLAGIDESRKATAAIRNLKAAKYQIVMQLNNLLPELLYSQT
jgi:hypothetical protein